MSWAAILNYMCHYIVTTDPQLIGRFFKFISLIFPYKIWWIFWGNFGGFFWILVVHFSRSVISLSVVSCSVALVIQSLSRSVVSRSVVSCSVVSRSVV